MPTKKFLDLNKIFIFDFDSTIITKESLDEMLLFSAEEDQKEKTRKKLEEITNQGMNGEIDLKESIQKRIELIALEEESILKFQQVVAGFITPGIKESIRILKNKKHEIYFISGGLLACVLPVAEVLNIPGQNCFANTYRTENDKIILDIANPLITSKGKSKVIVKIKKENKAKKIIIVGDGISDLIPYEEGAADDFLGFGINQIRPAVRDRAPHYFTDIKEFNKFIKKY